MGLKTYVRPGFCKELEEFTVSPQSINGTVARLDANGAAASLVLLFKINNAAEDRG